MKQIKLRKPRRRRDIKRRPINVIASALTTFGLYCGIASLFASIRGDYTKAAYLILAAIVFDILDGSVARMTNSISEFGKQLDSLCDLVSFGVAPAVLIYAAYLNEEVQGRPIIEGIGPFLAIIFVICGALRLARYNVYQSQVRDFFIGLPIPAAGGTVATFVLFMHYFERTVGFWVLGPLALVLAYLMVSSVRYPKDKLKMFLLRPRNAFRLLAFFAIGIGIFHYASSRSPAIVLFPGCVAYVLFGLFETAYEHYRKSRRERAKGAADKASQEEEPRSEPSPSKTGDAL